MNKKQLIVALVMGIIITIFFGLETTHTDYPESSVDLSIYGKYIGSDIAIASYSALGILAYSGNYKYRVIIATLIIGILLIYTLRDKKK